MKENIDWAKIRRKLPFEKTKEQYKQRSRLWKYIDVNNNGYLSLAEIDKGLRDILRLDEIFNSKPVIMRAFQAAKNAVKNKKKYGPDYVDRSEFRLLLLYLRQYYEYYQAFKRIDTSGDRRIDIHEFIQAIPDIEKWVGKIKNPYKTFQKIDTNHGGKILFDEFCKWAIRMDLDLDDDDDQLNFQYSQFVKQYQK